VLYQELSVKNENFFVETPIFGKWLFVLGHFRAKKTLYPDPLLTLITPASQRQPAQQKTTIVDESCDVFTK